PPFTALLSLYHLFFFILILRRPLRSTLFPYTTLFRSNISSIWFGDYLNSIPLPAILAVFRAEELDNYGLLTVDSNLIYSIVDVRSEEHTSELQSQSNLVCRLLLEKKKKKQQNTTTQTT